MENAVLAVSLGVMLHAAYSMLEYRRYTQDVLNRESYSLPLDIVVEALAALVLAMIASISKYTGNFQEMLQKKKYEKMTYAESATGRTLRPVMSSRSKLFVRAFEASLPDIKDIVKKNSTFKRMMSRF